MVEYKGEHLMFSEDTKEKQALGDLWEKRSQGKCLFVTVTAKKFGTIPIKITVLPSGQQFLFN